MPGNQLWLTCCIASATSSDRSMAFHKKATLDIEVDFIRFERITKK